MGGLSILIMHDYNHALIIFIYKFFSKCLETAFLGLSDDSKHSSFFTYTYISGLHSLPFYL